MAASFSRAPHADARKAVQEARTASPALRERLVFLLGMPLVVAVVNGWALSGDGQWFTRPQSVLYWVGGMLPLWWVSTAVGAAGARTRWLAHGAALWLWIAIAPLLTFVAAGLVGFFDWRWQLFASWFLDSVPERGHPQPGSAAWWLWMANGSVVPLITWTVANLLQRQLFGRTLLEPRAARSPVATATTSVPAEVPPAAAPEWVPAAASAVIPQAAPAGATPDFLRRLDKPLAGPLLAVQAQEHYIRIVGEGDAALLLYRFSDALEQLRRLHGLQVHRSWWVALGAVAALERDAGRLRLRLVNGERVPVSRRHSGAVELALRERAVPGSRAA